MEAFVDISDIKSAQEAIVLASRTKDDFLAKMSHELRTPLNAVIGYSDLLTDIYLEEGETSEKLEFVTRIKASGNDMLSMVNELLELHKLKASKVNLDIGMVNLTEFLQTLHASIASQVSKKNNVFKIDNQFESSNIETDALKLRQILFSLIQNANTYTESGQINLTIHSKTTKNRKCIEFEVQDTGIGIEADALERIFQPFEQADNSPTRKYNGAGLGLTISQELIHLLGGRIDVTSSPGAGSSFKVRLPASYD